MQKPPGINFFLLVECVAFSSSGDCFLKFLSLTTYLPTPLHATLMHPASFKGENLNETGTEHSAQCFSEQYPWIASRFGRSRQSLSESD